MPRKNKEFCHQCEGVNGERGEMQVQKTAWVYFLCIFTQTKQKNKLLDIDNYYFRINLWYNLRAENKTHNYYW